MPHERHKIVARFVLVKPPLGVSSLSCIGVTTTRRTHLASRATSHPAATGRLDFLFWGRAMSYRIVYDETSARRDETEWWPDPPASEEFATEHQALGRARELLETGEHFGVALRDHRGNELSGVRLQLKLGGFSGD